METKRYYHERLDVTEALIIAFTEKKRLLKAIIETEEKMANFKFPEGFEPQDGNDYDDVPEFAELRKRLFGLREDLDANDSFTQS